MLARSGVLTVLIIGALVAVALTQKSQDNRQQAAGVATENCRQLYTTQAACNLHRDKCSWQQVGTNHNDYACVNITTIIGAGGSCGPSSVCAGGLTCLSGVCSTPQPTTLGVAGSLCGGAYPACGPSLICNSNHICVNAGSSGGGGNPGNGGGNTGCQSTWCTNETDCRRTPGATWTRDSNYCSAANDGRCCLPANSGGGGTPPTPTAPPVTVKGFFDNVDNGTCTYLTGWACDSKNYDKPLRVAVYVDAFSQDRLIDEAAPLATGVRNDLTVRDCNGTTAHGFRVDLTTARAKQILTKGVYHTLMVKAVGLSGTAGNYLSDPNKGPFIGLPSAGVSAPIKIKCN